MSVRGVKHPRTPLMGETWLTEFNWPLTLLAPEAEDDGDRYAWTSVRKPTRFQIRTTVRMRPEDEA